MPFHIVLHEPEIPPNTGSIMRLAANTGATLHLVEPLGFDLDDSRMRRAGLDYREWADVRLHACLTDALAAAGNRVWAISTRGQRTYTEVSYRRGDVLLFGAETRGLPDNVLKEMGPHRTLRLPMQPGSRSINLANAVAVVLFEAWRQAGFSGAQ